MRLFRSIATRAGYIALAGFAVLLSQAPAAQTGGDQKDSRYDDPKFCSKSLAAGNASLSADAHKQCVIAIVSTYLAAEQGKLPPAQVPCADDVARHKLATPAVFAPGNRARVVAALDQSIIGEIKDPEWAVEGDTAWVNYDGYLEIDPAPVKFPFTERVTIEKGLIKEIFLIVAHGPQ
jgi:hypothetical protein